MNLLLIFFYKIQDYQLQLFSVDPTPEEIVQDKVKRLKEDIWKIGKEKTLSRVDIYTGILRNWFGKIKGTHMTQALKGLQQEGRIFRIEGPLSKDSTRFTFRASD